MLNPAVMMLLLFQDLFWYLIPNRLSVVSITTRNLFKTQATSFCTGWQFVRYPAIIVSLIIGESRAIFCLGPLFLGRKLQDLGQTGYRYPCFRWNLALLDAAAVRVSRWLIHSPRLLTGFLSRKNLKQGEYFPCFKILGNFYSTYRIEIKKIFAVNYDCNDVPGDPNEHTHQTRSRCVLVFWRSFSFRHGDELPKNFMVRER